MAALPKATRYEFLSSVRLRSLCPSAIPSYLTISITITLLLYYSISITLLLLLHYYYFITITLLGGFWV